MAWAWSCYDVLTDEEVEDSEEEDDSLSDFSQIDVRPVILHRPFLSINGSNKYMMTLEPVTSSPEPRRTLSHVGHYVSLDSWLASLTITFLI